MLTYEQTLAYIFQKLPMFQRIGAAAFKKDLTNIRALCAHLGNPQNAYRIIHVAGTNGKGSTSHLLASVLQSAGYKVGLHTSPHYKDFRERSKVNGELMSETFVVEFVERLRPLIETIEPSFFEISVAMAFDYFRYCGVEVAVIEVGLGGRLDSTNIVAADLCVITNIGYDHMQFLGDTLAAIAGEKAGIIKSATPVVVGERHVETDDVFIQQAAQQQAALTFAEDTIQATRLAEDYAQGVATYRIDDRLAAHTYTLAAGLLGDYQQKNIQTVLAAIRVLQHLPQPFNIDNDAIANGIRNVQHLTKMVGRWQILGQNPLTIADAAHNEHGMRYVVRQLAGLSYQHLHIVFGMVSDKDISKVLQLLPTQRTTYYFCKADIPRGKAAHELQQEAAVFGLQGNVYTSVIAALEAAQAAARPDDVVYVGGSIFVIAEVL